MSPHFLVCCTVHCYYYHYYSLFTSTKPQSLNIVVRKVWLQRRLIGVKGVEKGNHISPLGAIDNCWNRKVDSLFLSVINVTRLPISQRPSDSRYIRFLWQLTKMMFTWFVFVYCGGSESMEWQWSVVLWQQLLPSIVWINAWPLTFDLCSTRCSSCACRCVRSYGLEVVEQF